MSSLIPAIMKPCETHSACQAAKHRCAFHAVVLGTAVPAADTKMNRAGEMPVLKNDNFAGWRWRRQTTKVT